MTDARAMVLNAPLELELQTFPIPQVGDDDAVMRVEASGICGTDYECFNGEYPRDFPVILGHEPLGIIEEIGEQAAARWGVQRGDRVVVEPRHGCGNCRSCLAGERCEFVAGGYGSTSTTVAPALWGSHAEYMYLAPGSRLHRVDPELPLRLAALTNPMAAGFSWAIRAAGLRAGDSIAILGCGQRGLVSTVAAHHAGASQILVTGLSRDEHKLSLAKEFGADTAINVEERDALVEVLERTDGRGVDVVLDLTPYATEPVVQALQMVRLGGTVVLAGLKGSHRIAEFSSDVIVTRSLTVKGVLGVDGESFGRALRLIESRRYPLERLHTHHFPLEETEQAIRTLAGEMGEPAISITIEP